MNDERPACYGDGPEEDCSFCDYMRRCAEAFSARVEVGLMELSV